MCQVFGVCCNNVPVSLCVLASHFWDRSHEWVALHVVTPSLQLLPMPSGSQTFLQGQVSLPLVGEAGEGWRESSSLSRLAPEAKEFPSFTLDDEEIGAETERSMFLRAKELLFSLSSWKLARVFGPGCIMLLFMGLVYRVCVSGLLARCVPGDLFKSHCTCIILGGMEEKKKPGNKSLDSSLSIWNGSPPQVGDLFGIAAALRYLFAKIKLQAAALLAAALTFIFLMGYITLADAAQLKEVEQQAAAALVLRDCFTLGEWVYDVFTSVFIDEFCCYIALVGILAWVFVYVLIDALDNHIALGGLVECAFVNVLIDTVDGAKRVWATTNKGETDRSPLELQAAAGG